MWGAKETLTVIAAVALCVLLVPGARAADVPRWIVEASRIPVPDHSPETGAVILLEEQHVKVKPDGTIVASWPPGGLYPPPERGRVGWTIGPGENP